MANTKCKTEFLGSQKQTEALAGVFEKYAGEKGALMPIMQEAQDIYGYLPFEVQTAIAEKLRIPIEEVYSTATFYSQFALEPKGKHRISICLGTACYVKGSGLALERITQCLGIENGESTADGLFSLDACRCIGACGLAPVMMVNDDVYGRVTPDEIDGILEKYRTM